MSDATWSFPQLQAARNLARELLFPWSHAVAPPGETAEVRNSELVTFDLDLPLSTVADPANPQQLPLSAGFEARDRELAWRDIVLATAIISVASRARTVWGASFGMLRIPAIPRLSSSVFEEGDPNYRKYVIRDLAQAAGVAPANITYVARTAQPSSVLTVDGSFYSRDMVLYEALSRMAEAVFGDSPVVSSDVATILATAWSQARAAKSDAEASLSLPMQDVTFTVADKNLAWRDNWLASEIADLVNVLAYPFDTAQRLLLEVTGTGARSPEIYVLSEDDGRYRTFTAAPLLPGSLRIVYDRLYRMIRWVTEDAIQFQPFVPADYTFPGVTAGQTLSVLGSVPGRAGASWLREKASRLQLFEDLDIPLSHMSGRCSDFVVVSGKNYVPLQNGAGALTKAQASVTFRLPAIEISPAPQAFLVSIVYRPISEISPLLPVQEIVDSTSAVSYPLPLPSGTYQFYIDYDSGGGGPVQVKVGPSRVIAEPMVLAEGGSLGPFTIVVQPAENGLEAVSVTRVADAAINVTGWRISPLGRELDILSHELRVRLMTDSFTPIADTAERAVVWGKSGRIDTLRFSIQASEAAYAAVWPPNLVLEIAWLLSAQNVIGIEMLSIEVGGSVIAALPGGTGEPTLTTTTTTTTSSTSTTTI